MASPQRQCGTFAAPLILLAMLPAQVHADPIAVHPHGDLLGLPLALAIEIPIVAAFFPGRRVRIAFTSAVATTVTYCLLLWAMMFVDSRFGVTNFGAWVPLIVGELVAIIAEGAAYAVVSREPSKAFVASALANVASFAVGLALF